MEPGFEIFSNGVDTETLAAELARAVAERTEAGVYSPGVRASLAERLPDEDGGGDLPPLAALDYAATRAASSWEVTTSYQVATEKSSIARPFIIFTKRLARLWARIAVGPIQREQTAFNRHVSAALEAVRRQAAGESMAARAMEEDLCALAEAMAAGDESRELAARVVEATAGLDRVVLLGPAPAGVREALSGAGRAVLPVSAGGTWDETPREAAVTAAPLTFLSGLEEETVPALLVCEISFWLRPESLIDLLRRAYLVLRGEGLAIVAVRSFAAGAPAPAWCSSPVVSRALELAGFEPGAPVGLPGGGAGYLLTARKPRR